MTTDAHTSEINPNGPEVLLRLAGNLEAFLGQDDPHAHDAAKLAAVWQAERVELHEHMACGHAVRYRHWGVCQMCRADSAQSVANTEKQERLHQQYRAERAENALAECRIKALEEAAQIVDGWAGSYPADMFPPGGNDRDSIAGTALRRVLPMVAGAIRSVIAGPEGGER